MRNYISEILLNDIPSYLLSKLTSIGLKAGVLTTSQPTHQEEKVYDILNAGPRNRFTVLGNTPFIVHNCTGHQYVMRWLYHITQIRAESGVTMRPLVADLHDATYWTAPADQAEAAGEVIQEGLTRLNDELQLSVKFKGKTKIGDNLEIAG